MATNQDVLDAIAARSAGGAETAVAQPSLSFFEMVDQAITNTPASAAQFGEDLVQPFVDPIGTANSIASLGKGIVQLAIPGEQEDEKTARAVGAYFVDRYGSLEDAKRTFAADPVGFLGDASMIITGGASAAVRAPGKIGSVAQTAQKIGEAVDPINIATGGVKVGAKGVGMAVPAAIGLTTGTSGQSLGEAYKAGREGGARQEAFVENMRGAVDPAEVVDDAREAFQRMKKDTRAEFKQSKDALQLQQTQIDFFPIAEQIKDLEASFDYEGFSELSSAGQTKMRELNKLIKNFQTNEAVQTAYGLDALKRAIDDLYPRDINPGNEAVIVARARDIVKDAILAQAPEYNTVMRPYEQARRLEIEMQKALSLGDSSAADTALRKLQSVMRDNVNANFGSRLRLVEQLEKAGDALLIPKVAGQDLQAIAPRGLGRAAGGLAALQSLANPKTAALLPFTSPRLMGETANLSGQGVRALSDAQQMLAEGNPMLSSLAQSVQSNIDLPSAASRSRGIGMLDRAATEEEEAFQQLQQLLNVNQNLIAQ